MLDGMRATVVVVVIAILGCSSLAPRPPGQSRPPAAVTAPAPPRMDPMAMGGFPVPPRQGHAPTVAASTAALPASLVSTVGALFRHGLADPRGCAYREIEVMVGSVWGVPGGPVKTHGWVLPARTDGKTWAIAWDGLVYPAISAGEDADLRADVSAIIAQQLASRAGAKSGASSRISRRRAPEEHSVSYETATARKVALVLQIGEVSLASQLWDALELPGEIEKGGDPYVWLAVDWAWELFERAVTAHMRGDTPVALASARLLTAAAPQIEAEAIRRGQIPERGGDDQAEARHITFIEQLPLLVADEERRARRGPRPFRPGLRFPRD